MLISIGKVDMGFFQSTPEIGPWWSDTSLTRLNIIAKKRFKMNIAVC